MPNQAEIQKYFDGIEGIGDRALFTDEQNALESLVGHEGFSVLLGLMVGTRQGFLTQLGAMPLSTEPGRYQAAVLQGQIKGLNLLPQLVLDQFPSGGADSAATK